MTQPEPVTPGRAPPPPGEAQGISLVLETRKGALKYEDDNQREGMVVSWSPPVPNWNPWTSCNIDEGHMASVSFGNTTSK